jgi:hypothetical protein
VIRYAGGTTDPRHIADLRREAGSKRWAATHHPRAREDLGWAEAVIAAADQLESYDDLLEGDGGEEGLDQRATSTTSVDS